MELKIHTVGITGSHETKPGENPGVQFHSILEIDGCFYDQVQNIRVLSGGEEFTTVMVRLLPSKLEYVNHDADSWKAMIDEIQTIRKGAGWSLSLDEKEEPCPTETKPAG